LIRKPPACQKSWIAPVYKLDNWPRMIQLAWSLRDEQGAVLQEWAQIIKPEGFAIPKEASRVHGITTEKRIARANYWLMFYLGVRMGLSLPDRPAVKDYCGSIFGRRVTEESKISFAYESLYLMRFAI
jgi:hypothetical protein